MTNLQAPYRSVVFIIQNGLHVPFYERFPSRLFFRVFVSCFHLCSHSLCVLSVFVLTRYNISAPGGPRSAPNVICTERRLRGA